MAFYEASQGQPMEVSEPEDNDEMDMEIQESEAEPMEGISKSPRKYIYVRGHSNLRPDLTTVKVNPGTRYINTIEPNQLCYHSRETLSVLARWGLLLPEERSVEGTFRNFLRDLRRAHSSSRLKQDVAPISDSQIVVNQMFEFWNKTGDMYRNPTMGIFDLDMVKSDPFYLANPIMIDQPLTGTITMNVEQLHDFIKSKFPSNPVTIILGGCRIELTPERRELIRQFNEVQDSLRCNPSDMALQRRLRELDVEIRAERRPKEDPYLSRLSEMFLTHADVTTQQDSDEEDTEAGGGFAKGGKKKKRNNKTQRARGRKHKRLQTRGKKKKGTKAKSTRIKRRRTRRKGKKNKHN